MAVGEGLQGSSTMELKSEPVIVPKWPLSISDLQIPAVSFDLEGNIQRIPLPTLPANAEIPEPVSAFDTTIDSDTGVWARIFLPQQIDPAKRAKGGVPIILYFFGGGFTICSADNVRYHKLCCQIAAELGAVVVSVNYRRAPENRLPAAFEDGYAAVMWLRSQALAKLREDSNQGSPDETPDTQAEAETVQPNMPTQISVDDKNQFNSIQSQSQRDWINHFRSISDFSSCFLMGHSSGAVIVRHVAAKVGMTLSVEDLSPLSIKGLIVCAPGFAGHDLTASESDPASSSSDLTLLNVHSFFSLALPLGADLNHPFAHFVSHESVELKSPWFPPMLLVLAGKDVMRDRQIEYGRALLAAGRDVQIETYHEYGHSFPFPCLEDHHHYPLLNSFIQRCLLTPLPLPPNQL